MIESLKNEVWCKKLKMLKFFKTYIIKVSGMLQAQVSQQR